MEQMMQFFVDLSLRKVKWCSLNIIYVTNSFEFQGTNIFCSLNTNNKPNSIKLEKTIASDSNFLRLIKPVLAVCMKKNNNNIPLYISTTRVPYGIKNDLK